MEVFQGPLSLACRKLPGKSVTSAEGSELKDCQASSTKKSVITYHSQSRLTPTGLRESQGPRQTVSHQQDAETPKTPNAKS